ncbi:MAG: hypothetical protein A3J93_03690 [Candidatus Magasanikbacteria bacterium RIFOXYC2_FULL_42_28]|uniref:Uncharacterized protein n=1 Tax=Candidatus Magasanikbacteria bacterium RIFOXYC2_FULL_42_28 TaxID=1798704 RepID=A0A1F6NUV7_9BACT|nr:MAG: hypothetical protein A3J93_03690 [Candidatus Magasanikbacteria bacterium RIFOXYC2_FULL_42_28]
MKTIIEIDRKQDEVIRLHLSNDDYDDFGWIDMWTTKEKEGDEPEQSETVNFFIDDLRAALEGFVAQRELQHKRDQMLKENE